MEMRMLPSNVFAYNFNGDTSLNTFGQLAVHPSAHHHLNSSLDLIENMPNDHHHASTHLLDDKLHSNQLYELQPHHATTNSLSNYNQTNMDNSNKTEPPVISLFKLKNYLNQPKKLNTSTSMQSMFSTGQELSSSGLQLLSSSNAAENSMNLVNHDNNLNHSSSLQTTSAPFSYNNLASSAIGISAIMSSPMLLSQSNSIVNNTHNQSMNFESSSGLRLPINHTSQSSAINSTTHQVGRSTRMLTSKEANMTLKKFTCKYCQETYQSKGEMQIHTTAHHREAKPYKCSFDKCNKRFQKTNYLKQHKRIHTNETPFTCPYDTCLRKFKQQSHVRQHVRTHTGDKPYKCKFSNCDKGFSQESNLRSHMRSHESGRPFKCNSCHLTFLDENELLKHIPKHRETKHTKIHICDYCGKSYSIELYLSKHVQHKHADKINGKLSIAAITTNQSSATTVITTRSKSKSNVDSSQHINKSNEENSPSNSPSSSSSHKSNFGKSKKVRSSPMSSSITNGSNYLNSVQQARIQQNTVNHINYSLNQHNGSWNNNNKSNAGSNSPDSVNSNCMSSSTNSEMMNISSGNNNNLSIGQTTADSSMFTDLNVNGSLQSRYDNSLQQSVDLFYNHHHSNVNSMQSSNVPSAPTQHQSAFTALGRTNQNSPKYFTSTNTCESFAFNKPSQYSSISTNSNQLHSTSGNQSAQHSLSTVTSNQQQQSIHNSPLQDTSQMLSNQSIQMHQLSPLCNGHITSTHNSSLIGNTQTSPVQLQHLQHSQVANQHQATNQQLISLNQIRNYACMPNNGSSTIHLQPQSQSNTSQFVNNIFFNARNNPSSLQSMSSCNEYPPIMIIQ